MKRNFATAAGAASALAAAAVVSAVPAAAAPTGIGSAADTVKSLQDEGYNVMVNGSTSAPLSECSVTAIHPTGAEFSGVPPTQFTTVYVDISCPSDD
jgi:hypothetical protein